MALFLLVSAFNSCQKDEYLSIETVDSLRELKNNLNFCDKFKNEYVTDFTSTELLFSKSLGRFINNTGSENKSNVNDTVNLEISASLVDISSLNNILGIEGLSVIAMTLFKDISNDFIEGFIIYVIDSTNEVKLYIYKNTTNDLYERIDLDAKTVNDFKYDHIFYVSKKFFPSMKIESLVVSTINNFQSFERPDDFLILELVSRFYPGNNYKNFSIEDEPYISSGDDKPCGQVPICWNGGANTYCAPFAQGCRVKGGAIGICPKMSVTNKFIDLELFDEKSQFEVSLPNEILYSF